MKHVIACMRALCPISDETVKELESLVGESFACSSTSFWLVDGEEITTSFSCEGGIVFSMDELYYNKKSEEFVETLEDVEVYRIELTDLRRLFETNLEFCNWGRIIHQNEYRRLHRSHKERLTLPARQRYEEFKKQFPYVCQRTNLGYIASYLGITLSTLSRLRSNENDKA